MTDKQIAEAREIAAGAGLDERTDYSGRGVYGSIARWAAEGFPSPGSPTGRRLLALGANWDQMGLDYIYYEAQPTCTCPRSVVGHSAACPVRS